MNIIEYQKFYWNVLLKSVYDILKICRGMHCYSSSLNKEKRKRICEKYNILYKHDRLGLVQNIAIKLHSKVEYIIKIH